MTPARSFSTQSHPVQRARELAYLRYLTRGAPEIGATIEDPNTGNVTYSRDTVAVTLRTVLQSMAEELERSA